MHLLYVLLTPGTDTGMGLPVEGTFRDFPSSEGPRSGISGAPLQHPSQDFFSIPGGLGRGGGGEGCWRWMSKHIMTAIPLFQPLHIEKSSKTIFSSRISESLCRRMPFD